MTSDQILFAFGFEDFLDLFKGFTRIRTFGDLRPRFLLFITLC